MIYRKKEEIIEYAKWLNQHRGAAHICLADSQASSISVPEINFVKMSADTCSHLVVNISTTFNEIPEIWQAIKDVDDVIVWPWHEDLSELIQELHPNIFTRSQYSVLTKSEKESLLKCKAEFIKIKR